MFIIFALNLLHLQIYLTNKLSLEIIAESIVFQKKFVQILDFEDSGEAILQTNDKNMGFLESEIPKKDEELKIVEILDALIS